MKWMLVVLVFERPIETGLLYNSLDECLKTEASLRAEWDRVYSANAEKISGALAGLAGLRQKADDQRHLRPARRTASLNGGPLDVA